MNTTPIIDDQPTEAKDNTLYIVLVLQILLLVERIFQNALKRIKHMRCSDCCSIDTASISSSDSPPRKRRGSSEHPKINVSVESKGSEDLSEEIHTVYDDESDKNSK